jgi:hypothetical protein
MKSKSLPAKVEDKSNVATLPQFGIVTASGIIEDMNNDGYVSMMQNVAGVDIGGSGAGGAAGMSSPTARRMMSRIAAGMIPMNAMLANEQSGIGHRICAEPVRAAMLAGYSIVTDTPEQEKAVKDLFEDLNVWRVVGDACVWRRAAGWSIIVKGEDFIRPHPSYRITPSNDWFDDYRSRFFGLPLGWNIDLKSPVGGSVYVNQWDSWLVGDKDHDPLYRIAGAEFGTPVLGRVYAALERLGLTHELIISVLSLSIQDIYQREELNEDLRTPAGERKAAKRIGGIAATRMLNDMVAIDKEEQITRLQSNINNQADLLDIAIRVISAESGIPVSVLANNKPGLSSGDSSGDDVWMRLVESEQAFYIIPALKHIAFHFLGIRADFVPNKSQGDIKRDADTDYVRAQTVKMYYDMRAITSEEARETGKGYASFTALTENLPSDGLKKEDTGNNNSGSDDEEDDDEV